MVDFVGERIRKAREDRGVSQKKLGMALGLSDKAISAYEAGRTYPPIDTLFRIATELKKPVIYFLSEDKKEVALHDKVDSINEKLKLLQDSFNDVKRLMK